MANTNPARGMRDFLPVDVRRREYVIGIIKEVYESYGFEPLETPAVENLETLTGKYGEEGNQLIFKILKRGEHEKSGEADLALRYDLTVPLARVVANHKNDLPKFFKRYQIQPVWRADRPARGRFREFYQCDVDAIGSNSMIVEAELCAAVSEILLRLGFKNYEIRINHREILRGMLNAAGINEQFHIEALTIIDKKDKTGIEKMNDDLNHLTKMVKGALTLKDLFLKILERQLQIIEQSEIEPFSGFEEARIALANSINNASLDYLSGFIRNSNNGVSEIRNILALVSGTSAAGNIKVDLSLARGLSYYTGAIFEINVPDLAGSLGGGGRYDGLIGMFGKEQIPACGFSLGLERILVVMDERGMFPAELQNASADVLVTVWNGETISESLELATDLRAQGLRVLVYPEADKLGKQFKYASSINVPFVAILGDEERAEGLVALKNMQTGEQKTISRNEVAETIKIHKQV
ncbi:MAG: histidine--tRNA ligase [Acidobacteria bacterium]|nr:histidine--tRNA ligase [Acidobacteriota bacterium]MCA1636825.1 histidine--tRNA ligase [Acidobacteriota bacterium]